MNTTVALTAAQALHITEALQCAIRALPPAVTCDFNGNMTDAGDVMRGALAILAAAKGA